MQHLNCISSALTMSLALIIGVMAILRQLCCSATVAPEYEVMDYENNNRSNKKDNANRCLSE